MHCTAYDVSKVIALVVKERGKKTKKQIETFFVSLKLPNESQKK